MERSVGLIRAAGGDPGRLNATRSRWQSCLPWSRLLRCAPLVALTIAVTSTNAAASEPSNPYSFDSTDCTWTAIPSFADPVTAVFRGSNAGPDNVVANIAAHTDWDSGNGDPQGLRVHDGGDNRVCRANAESMAGPESDADQRMHVRLWKSDRGVGYERKTVGTPHYDDWSFCGHAIKEYPSTRASGFDYGRLALRGAFNRAGHQVQTVYWGNTLRMKQCDETRVSSVGAVALIRVDHGH
jgi:hypothetical protein